MKFTPEFFAILFAAAIFLGIMIYSIRGYLTEQRVKKP